MTDTHADALVLVSQNDGVRTITINRPDAYNSLNKALRLELRAAFEDAAAAASPAGGEVRAVVLNATGGAFCTGQDLKEQLKESMARETSDKVVEEYNPMIAALLSIPVPVIAAIQGPAAGAGWGIAMACDFRIMSTSASFKGAFTGVGLSADAGLSQTLADVVGKTRALQLLLLDEKIDAETAASLDLVYQVVEPEALDEAVGALAARFAGGPTMAYKELKALLRNADAVHAAADLEAGAQGRLFLTDDHLESVMAFVEKRQPKLQGR